VGSLGCSNPEPAAQARPGKAEAAPAAKAGADQPLRVKVVRPVREHLRRLTTPQPAHVGAYEKTDVYSRISGYVDRLGTALDVEGKPLLERDGQPRPLDIGDRVVEDQVLAKLWVPEMERELELKKARQQQARAEVRKYEAERVFLEAELTRLLQLIKNQVIQEVIADEKRLQRDTVLAAIAAAQAREQVALRETEVAAALLDYATIKAPFSGLITRRLVDTRAFVQSAATGKAEPLFTVARIDRLRIIADIPEAEAGPVKVGQTATLQLSGVAGRPLTGKVVRFADALDPATRTMRTEVELDAPPKNLRPGMFGALTIQVVDAPDALLIPTSALRGGGKPAVFVVEDGRARRRDVDVGFNDGVRVQITRGLSGDEAVIADSDPAPREGQAVDIAR
jgi:RND family efflux transporter MFP subunit